jgi:tRNA (guanine37-N1)-methyltransferase
MQINILTLFPEFFRGSLESSILKRAQKVGAVTYKLIQLRDFAENEYGMVDDRPFGGGPGMVMMIGPIDRALKSLGVAKGQANKLIILTSAKGKLFTQETARNWSNLTELTIICGHYEGVDERVAEQLVDLEIRIGDYVLTGGESAAAVIVDAVTRLLPGVLGNELSNQDESHSVPGELGFPQYTRPEEYSGHKVPNVLLSGNHLLIQQWRAAQKTKSAD